MKKKNEYIIITITIIFSIIIGIISKDIIIGSLILATGILCAYFASLGKRINYILGFINYILMAYVSLKNNLYGMVCFYTFVFAPLQIRGFISWNKKLDDNKNVKVRGFTLKNSILITILCILSSLILGYLLSLIPKQQLSLLDATSNCINLCGVILMILRFRESWWIWLINNIIDLIIWIIIFINNGNNSFMMLLTSIAYLLINIYGIIKWNIKAKEELK